MFTGKATIVEAARATSAATSFFEPITIEGLAYIDGAFGANNPSLEAWNEARNLWRPREKHVDDAISCFISIGCGSGDLSVMGDSFWDIISKSMKNVATETDKTTRAFHEMFPHMFLSKRCFRFNVQQGLQKVGLEEWKKMGEIKNATDSYLRDPQTGEHKDSAVERLMEKECMEIEDYA